MLRWRSCTCACVQARVDARSNAAASWCLSIAPVSAARVPAAIVQNATRTIAPGATVTRHRSAATASSTVPVVPDSGPPSMAAASRIARPRPKNRARSVSASMLSRSAPGPVTIRCATQISGSPGVRRRRVANRAPSASRSVWTNILANAGWAMSSAGRINASSA